jgi:hypothetical protein
MTILKIPIELNQKSGILTVCYEANQSAEKSGFDMFAELGFDVTMCFGYPTIRAYISSFEGAGYRTASAWIQVVTRREFATVESSEPLVVVSDVDTHPLLEELGVPFFAIGFPAEMYDAPCNNLGSLGRLEWTADTFLVTMPNRANNHVISYVAGFCWGYCEYDLDGKRQVEINPVVKTDITHWELVLPLLQSRYSKWKYCASGLEQK